MILILLLLTAALSIAAAECAKPDLRLSPPISVGRKSLGFRLVS